MATVVGTLERMKRAVDRFDPQDPRDTAKIRKLERSIVRGYVYGSEHAAVSARFFVREGTMMEVEQKHLGVLMFRLDTGIETPDTVLVSLFFVALVAENVSAATRVAIRSAYGREGEAVLAWLRDGLHRLHRVLHPIGCTNSVTPGVTCLVTCAMRGHCYNLLKTEIYPLLVPKELYLDLDVDPTEEIRSVYFVITYDYNSDRRGRPAVYVVVTRLRHRQTLLNLLRYRFKVTRFYFLNHVLAGTGPATGYFATVQRLGWFYSREARAGVVACRGGQLPVVRLEKCFVDPGPVIEFS